MTEANKPPPKRRRILDPSALVPVSVYSNQVSSSLQLKAPVFNERESTEETEPDDGFWSKFKCKKSLAQIELSDSDEDLENVQCRPQPLNITDVLRSPSPPPPPPPPPPPESPVQRPSRKAKQKINEIDRQLQAVNSLLLSPDHDSRRRSARLRDSDLIVVHPGDGADDDIIITSPDPAPCGSPFMAPEREIPLKIRCRTDLHKIPVLPSTPLSAVVEQLSFKLRVPPTRLLLLREEVELNTQATVCELGLRIADIIECVVMAAAEDKGEAGAGGDIITVRLQGTDRTLTQECSLHRDAPLASIFSRYVSRLPAAVQKNICFHFDGSKVSSHQTPAQLDMEDGDIIEVWA